MRGAEESATGVPDPSAAGRTAGAARPRRTAKRQPATGSSAGVPAPASFPRLSRPGDRPVARRCPTGAAGRSQTRPHRWTYRASCPGCLPDSLALRSPPTTTSAPSLRHSTRANAPEKPPRVHPPRWPSTFDPRARHRLRARRAPHPRKARHDQDRDHPRQHPPGAQRRRRGGLDTRHRQAAFRRGVRARGPGGPPAAVPRRGAPRRSGSTRTTTPRRGRRGSPSSTAMCSSPRSTTTRPRAP